MTMLAQSYIPLWDGLEGNLDKIELIACDLWGVMHDGVHLHRGAEDAIKKARAQGVATVFLSNSPQPRWAVKDILEGMGIDKSLTDYIVTSGGMARDEIREKFNGAKLYHLGPGSDFKTVDGLPVDEVKSPGEADVIVASGLDYDTVEDHRGYLRSSVEKGTVLLCANPDRIVHVGNELWLCAGAIADLYESMGGEVHWFGKPTPEALLSCRHEAGMDDVAPEAMLMIGDSLITDIAGANAAETQSLLVTSGIHREDAKAAASHLTPEGLPLDIFKEGFGEKEKRTAPAVPSAMIKDLKW